MRWPSEMTRSEMRYGVRHDVRHNVRHVVKYSIKKKIDNNMTKTDHHQQYKTQQETLFAWS